MSTVLTVQTKLTGDASSMVSALRRAADALNDTEKAATNADRALNGSGAIGPIVRATGAMVKFAAGVATAGAAMGVAFGASAMKAGLDRLMSIQDATVALTRMLGSAEAAATLTGQVLKVVQGTPFAFPQFAEATRTLVAFGVEAEMVPRVLKAIADSAAASGEGAEAVGRITQAFANMAVSGRINSDIIQSLGTAGVNALGLLANHFKITTGEAQKMVSEGLITADEAMEILVKGIEKGSTGIAGDFKSLAGAAQDLGKTVSGSLGNVKAAFARMGASWLKPFEKDFPDVLNRGVIPLLDTLGKTGERVFQRFAESGALKDLTELLINMADQVDPLVDQFMALAAELPNVTDLGRAFGDMLPTVSDDLWRLAGILVRDVAPGMVDVFAALTPLIPMVGDLAAAFGTGLGAVLPPAAAGLGAILTIAQPLLEAVANLPEPILGIATGLMMMNKFGMPVGPILSGILGTLKNSWGPVVQNTTAYQGLSTALGAVKSGPAVTALGKVTGFLGGPWGMAIGIAIGALALFNQQGIGPTRQEIDGLKGSLDSATGAFTEMTTATVAKELVDSGAAGKARDLGISIETVTQAALGNKDALAELQGRVEENRAAQSLFDDTVGGVSDELWREREALEEVIAAVNGQNEIIRTAVDEQSLYLQAMGAARTAQTEFKATLDEATGSIGTNITAFGSHGEAMDANRSVLEGVEQKAKDYIETVKNSSGSQYDLSEATREAAKGLYDSGIQMGLTADEAVELTEKALGVPNRIHIDADGNFSLLYADLNQAVAMAQKLRDMLRNMPASAGGGLRGGPGYNGAMENGGIIAAQNGLMRQSMMARGGANILWAEPQTGWEAYISGKKSMKERSRRIWEAAGNKLGIMDDYTGGGGGGTTVQMTNQFSGQYDAETVGDSIASKLRFALG